MKKIFVAMMLMLAVFTVNAQQDCGVVDCPGRCGRFIDGNKDGFCDHGRLSQPAATQPTAKETASPAPAESPTTTPEKVNSKHKTPTDTTPTQNSTFTDTIASTMKPADTAASITTTPTDQKSNLDNPYPVYHILIGLLIFYGISILLVKKNVWQKATHRKVWNIALTVTFLISCLFGVLLAIFIHHGYYPHNYVAFLHIHVWFGIGMTIIAMFHALWHLNYFKAIFRKSDLKSTQK